MAVSLPQAPSLAADPNALNALRLQSNQDPKAAIAGAAKQFEAVFMRQLIHSMRDATLKSGLSDGEGTDLGRDLLDDQLATQLSGRPGGLGDLLARQLSRQLGSPAPPPATPSAPSSPLSSASSFSPPSASVAGAVPQVAAATTAAMAVRGPDPGRTPSARQSQFVNLHRDSAQAVQAQTGLPAAYLLAQAGHESGWGRREIRQNDGSASHNLFGIKAGAHWRGKVAEVATTEYVNGKATTQVARFRAYDSYAAAFGDYAQLISRSPRYAGVMAHTDSPQAFAQSLQSAGYATDPAYAQKLTQAINSTLRWQRALA